MATSNGQNGMNKQFFMEVSTTQEEHYRHLNPTTGTESDHHWPDDEPDVPPPPLLDLQSAWLSVTNGTLIPSSEDCQETASQNVFEKNASILVRELKFHILASSALNSSKIEGTANSDETGAIKLKSIYGASILLKLQWEDRTVQKKVPARTYFQLAGFIDDLLRNLETLLLANEPAARAVADLLAFDHTPLLFSRLLDGIETCSTELETSTFNLLMFCSKHANPKEMHMGILNFVRKIDSIYMQATSYLLFDPLIRIWGNVILRIPRKRHSFLIDFVRIYDKMNYSCEGYEHTSIPAEGGLGSEQAGRCNLISDIAIDFYSRLALVQSEHRSSSSTLKQKVDVLGRALPTFAVSSDMADEVVSDTVPEKLDKASKEAINAHEGKCKTDAGAVDDVKKAEAEGEGSAAEASDWVKERAVTLARALQLLSVVWARLAPPAQDRGLSVETPLKSMKRKSSMTREQLSAEAHLCTLVRLIKDLGWTNPVLACQVGTKGLSLESMAWEEDCSRDHLVEDMRSKKERKKTLYSVAGVAQFLCACLRPRTRKGVATENRLLNVYDVDLTGSGFDLLTGNHAFNLVAPFLIAMIGQSSVPMKMAGISTLRAFLQMTDEGQFASMKGMLKVRCGARSLGREVSLFGFSQQLGTSIGMLDNPVHRHMAYEALQMVLQRCEDPLGRYSITESLFLECTCIAVAGQLVTEMKDVLRYSDDVARKGKLDAWTWADASMLKTRFVQLVLPKYFVPRRDMLSFVNPVVATTNACVYVAGSDRELLKKFDEGSEEMSRVENRGVFMSQYMKLGRECVRALAAVAEHDRKTLPKSKFAKDAKEDVREIYNASGQTLNQCVSALSSISMAMGMMPGKALNC